MAQGCHCTSSMGSDLGLDLTFGRKGADVFAFFCHVFYPLLLRFSKHASCCPSSNLDSRLSGWRWNGTGCFDCWSRPCNLSIQRRASKLHIHCQCCTVFFVEVLKFEKSQFCSMFFGVYSCLCQRKVKWECVKENLSQWNTPRQVRFYLRGSAFQKTQENLCFEPSKFRFNGKIKYIRDFFITLFFAALGMQVGEYPCLENPLRVRCVFLGASTIATVEHASCCTHSFTLL